MNNFCEECGNKLSPSDKFCQECGAPTASHIEEPIQGDSSQSSKLTYCFFQDKKADLTSDKPSCKYGIVLTNFKQLKKKFGEIELERLQQNLSDYLEEHKKNGLYYLVLDASDNCLKTPNEKNWKQHIDLLQKAIKRVKSKLNGNIFFILIFGGDEIIPMPVFSNPNPNGNDKDVDSDLPYSTLSVKDPTSRESARTPLVAVGRIPTGVNSTANDLSNLLVNTLAGMRNFSTEKTFGLSTYCWQQVSAYVNNNVCKANLFISPALTVDNISKHYSEDTGVHYFNLHGSDRAPEWYGQKDSDYPVAFTPFAITTSRKHNIIGVEACYGARFINLKKEQSILLSALATNTVSFVGSSRVAWGPSTPPMNLADIVIHDYLALLQKGVSAGEAFLKARIHAFNNSCNSDPATSLLSMMEFNLFGDPAFAINSQKLTDAKGFFDQKGGVDGDSIEEIPEDELELTKADEASEPSIYSIVTQAVDAVQKQITDLINKQVWERYPEYKGVSPKFTRYSVQGKNFNKLTYQIPLEKFDKFLQVNTNEMGEIVNEFSSK